MGMFLLKVASQEVRGKVSSLARKWLEMDSRLKWNLEGDTGPGQCSKLRLT